MLPKNMDALFGILDSDGIECSVLLSDLLRISDHPTVSVDQEQFLSQPKHQQAFKISARLSPPLTNSRFFISLNSHSFINGLKRLWVIVCLVFITGKLASRSYVALIKIDIDRCVDEGSLIKSIGLQSSPNLFHDSLNLIFQTLYWDIKHDLLVGIFIIA